MDCYYVEAETLIPYNINHTDTRPGDKETLVIRNYSEFPTITTFNSDI